MHYEMLDTATNKPHDALQLHVLARAYQDAWRLLHRCDPEGTHVIEQLNLLIGYGNTNAAARCKPAAPGVQALRRVSEFIIEEAKAVATEREGILLSELVDIIDGIIDDTEVVMLDREGQPVPIRLRTAMSTDALVLLKRRGN